MLGPGRTPRDMYVQFGTAVRLTDVAEAWTPRQVCVKSECGIVIGVEILPSILYRALPAKMSFRT